MMRAQKRIYIWIGLLLAGVLCIPGNVVSANSEENGEILEVESGLSSNGVSDDKMDAPQQSDDNQESVSKNIFQKLENDSNEDSSASENLYTNERVEKKSLSVVLPTEISCYMILYENRKYKGVIGSDQFFIENRGYEDVIVSLEGFCQGTDGSDYFFSGATVDETVVQGKKNAYVYLKWENESGEEMERPRMIMGDAVKPGKAEIVLKAPSRNRKGHITGDHSGSKVYFSFAGDLNADTGEEWESGELELNLNYSIKSIISENVADTPNASVSTNDLKLPDSAGVSENSRVISDNHEVENSQSTSANNVVSVEADDEQDNGELLEKLENVSVDNTVSEGSISYNDRLEK